MVGWWTVGRATGVGITAGLAALVLWPLYAAYQERVFWWFVAALAIAGFCGVSILLITGADMVLRRRGRRLRPVRTFDLVVGFVLAIPCCMQLYALLSDYDFSYSS